MADRALELGAHALLQADIEKIDAAEAYDWLQLHRALKGVQVTGAVPQRGLDELFVHTEAIAGDAELVASLDGIARELRLVARISTQLAAAALTESQPGWADVEIITRVPRSRLSTLLHPTPALRWLQHGRDAEGALTRIKDLMPQVE